MLKKEDIERIRSMTPEEQYAEMLDTLSDMIRGFAKRIAMNKAIAYREHNVAPEDFDAALERELRKAWNKVKDKTAHELALMAFLELISNGMDPEKILEGE